MSWALTLFMLFLPVAGLVAGWKACEAQIRKSLYDSTVIALLLEHRHRVHEFLDFLESYAQDGRTVTAADVRKYCQSVRERLDA